ncbi:uncharacterized protein HD556DRAFT_771164 [Suillus plorans]|uniref:Uncharacterized protein n=1 Tax=Suillus plorans TaxID=116603 RepID=A0A9P7AHG0_9AGAM|nr:uncharacterized protein HD556DRAFT_771164 [Suillus plorans]KAG1789625.1 hypothetical protein HD556DRAFT_771164 [Suillus plorans]
MSPQLTSSCLQGARLRRTGPPHASTYMFMLVFLSSRTESFGARRSMVVKCIFVVRSRRLPFITVNPESPDRRCRFESSYAQSSISALMLCLYFKLFSLFFFDLTYATFTFCCATLAQSIACRSINPTSSDVNVKAYINTFVILRLPALFVS